MVSKKIAIKSLCFASINATFKNKVPIGTVPIGTVPIGTVPIGTD